jgi:hypothetical protein
MNSDDTKSIPFIFVNLMVAINIVSKKKWLRSIHLKYHVIVTTKFQIICILSTKSLIHRVWILINLVHYFFLSIFHLSCWQSCSLPFLSFSCHQIYCHMENISAMTTSKFFTFKHAIPLVHDEFTVIKLYMD